MKKLVCRSILILLLGYMFIMSGAVLVKAENISGPGTLEGEGQSFTITGSSYADITLLSADVVHVYIESVPEVVTVEFQPVSDVPFTTVTIQGLDASATYYKYEDDFHNLELITTDGSGSASFLQDLSSPHLVFVQNHPSTIFLSDSGWSVPVGTWDAVTRTATLTQDVAETIQIDSNNITLDGGGYSVNCFPYSLSKGIYLYQRSGVTVQDIVVKNFSNGVYLYYSNSNTLRGITAEQNTSSGITLRRSDDNLVENSRAEYNGDKGIYVYQSSDRNTLMGNAANFSVNGDGIYVFYYSNSNLLTGNTAVGNALTGITLYQSSGTTLRDNTMSGNRWNFAVDGSSVGHFKNDIDTSNLVDGRPVYYVQDAVGAVFDGSTDAGTFYCVNCDNVTVRDMALENSYNGVTFCNTSNSLIENVSVSNSFAGIKLYYGTADTVQGNILSDNLYGLMIGGVTEGNTVTANTIQNNMWGMHVLLNAVAAPDSIYRNNFIDNMTQASISSPVSLNLDKPMGGNFWSDWTGPDADADGFVDVPYLTSGSGVDYLPWTRKDGWNAPADTIAPTTTIIVSGTEGQNGWYVSDLQVTLVAADNAGGSGVQGTEYSLDGVTWAAYAGPFAIAAEGETTVSYRSTDNAGNAEATNQDVLSVDTTPPAITISGIVDGASYILRSMPAPTYTAVDAMSGVASDSAELTGGNANGVGVYTYTVRAADLAGNSADMSVSCTVVYDFSGFFSPVGRAQPFKLGSTLPVKFQLADAAGNFIPSAIATLKMQRFSSAEPLGEAIMVASENDVDTGSLFRYDEEDQQYICNFHTRNAGFAVGSWRLLVTLDDGEVKEVEVSFK